LSKALFSFFAQPLISSGRSRLCIETPQWPLAVLIDRLGKEAAHPNAKRLDRGQ
jgi:hypothetical protein